MRNSSLALITFITLMACGGAAPKQPSHQYEALRSLVDTARGHGAFDGLRAIVVVSEEGCMPCNRKMASAMEEALLDTSLLFVVSALGSGVDITPFLERPQRVIWDRKEHLRKSGILAGSGAIFLTESGIDTIIPVELNGLNKRLEFIAKCINEL